VQFVTTELPAGELEFDGQTMHVEFTEDPTAVEYVPAPQSVQVSLYVMLQVATKPEPLMLPSDLNSTCMYPVLDV
jgi:hypothetical protein